MEALRKDAGPKCGLGCSGPGQVKRPSEVCIYEVGCSGLGAVVLGSASGKICENAGRVDRGSMAEG